MKVNDGRRPVYELYSISICVAPALAWWSAMYRTSRRVYPFPFQRPSQCNLLFLFLAPSVSHYVLLVSIQVEPVIIKTTCIKNRIDFKVI